MPCLLTLVNILKVNVTWQRRLREPDNSWLQRGIRVTALRSQLPNIRNSMHHYRPNLYPISAREWSPQFQTLRDKGCARCWRYSPSQTDIKLAQQCYAQHVAAVWPPLHASFTMQQCRIYLTDSVSVISSMTSPCHILGRIQDFMFCIRTVC